jgi:hypothetical protein
MWVFYPVWLRQKFRFWYYSLLIVSGSMIWSYEE